jgi:hypothetical protein
MKTWIRKYWRWLVGAPLVVAVLSAIARIFRPKPSPQIPVPTKEEADEKREAVEAKKEEAFDRIDGEIDNDLEKIREKFGRN